MSKREQGETLPSLALEFVAKGIGDPVIRLRFLQYAAPVPAGRSKSRGALLLAAIPILLATLPVARFLARPDAHAAASSPSAAPRIQALSVPMGPSNSAADVWKVEEGGQFETYSNGLRIDNRYAIANHRRSYVVFSAVAGSASKGVPGSKPAGIVFHTTESRQAPLEAQQNHALQRIGESLLEYTKRRRAYHFLIDRFGRVFRLVIESDAANHAGYSVWADETGVYINLNESFLGVSFEADTQPGQLQASVSPAQIRSAAMLTEMLRSRYAIPAVNCVTHAQVSVNPSNMRVGYHTDWASSFPYEQLGLPNNYARPSPAIVLFGFEYDSGFLHWAGTQLYAGIESAGERVRESARRSGMPPAAYRKTLQQRYRERLSSTRHGVAVPEEGGE